MKPREAWILLVIQEQCLLRTGGAYVRYFRETTSTCFGNARTAEYICVWCIRAIRCIWYRYSRERKRSDKYWKYK